jgi:hypothetical protein
MILRTDKWDGTKVIEDEISNPSWSDIQKAINKLNCNIYSIVDICLTDKQGLTIGGGENHFIVYISEIDGSFLNLYNDTSNNALIRIRIGGQEGEYLSMQVVDKMSAVRAAQYYFERHCANPDLLWKKE